jgi:hypothetical protein
MSLTAPSEGGMERGREKEAMWERERERERDGGRDGGVEGERDQDNGFFMKKRQNSLCLFL